MNASIGECAPCNDSPLSYTGNITGIFTFLLGVIASVLATYALTRGALDEIDSLADDLDRTSRQVVAFLEYCDAESKRKPNPEVEDRQLSLMDSLRSLKTTLTDILKSFSNLKKFDGRSMNPFPFQIRRRVQWIMKRQKFVDGMTRISTQKGEVIAAQMILLLK